MERQFILFFGSIVFLYLSSCNRTAVSQEPKFDKTVEINQNKVLEVLSDIPVYDNFKRDSVSKYGSWIRNLKLNKDSTVYYYNGDTKSNQFIHVAV